MALGKMGEREGREQHPGEMHAPGSAEQDSLLGRLRDAAAAFTGAPGRGAKWGTWGHKGDRGKATAPAQPKTKTQACGISNFPVSRTKVCIPCP